MNIVMIRIFERRLYNVVSEIVLEGLDALTNSEYGWVFCFAPRCTVGSVRINTC